MLCTCIACYVAALHVMYLHCMLCSCIACYVPALHVMYLHCMLCTCIACYVPALHVMYVRQGSLSKCQRSTQLRTLGAALNNCIKCNSYSIPLTG